MKGFFMRLGAIARKEVLQLSRDRLTAGFVVGMPLMQILLFGYAINQDVRNVPTAVLDRSMSSVSRKLLGELEASQTFRMTRRVSSEAEARRVLGAGEVKVVVVIPPEFTKRYYRGPPWPTRRGSAAGPSTGRSSIRSP